MPRSPSSRVISEFEFAGTTHVIAQLDSGIMSRRKSYMKIHRKEREHKVYFYTDYSLKYFYGSLNLAHCHVSLCEDNKRICITKISPIESDSAERGLMFEANNEKEAKEWMIWLKRISVKETELEPSSTKI